MAYILNENYEFQIGDRIIVYGTNKDIISLMSDDSATRLQVNNMPKGKSFSYKHIPNNANWNQIQDGMDDILAAAFICGCDIEIEASGCCEVRIFGRCRTFGDGGGEVTINITPNTVLTNLFSSVTDVDGDFSITVDGLCDFPFSNHTQLRVEAEVDPSCIFGRTQRDIFVFEPNRSCDPDNQDSGWLWEQDGNQAISFRVNTYDNWFSHYNQAEVFSYQFSAAKNTWRQADAEFLSARIIANRRNQVCNFFSSDNEPRDCNDCDHRKARVNTGLANTGGRNNTRYCTGDIIGEFEKQNITSQINLVHELEHECCL